MSPKIVLLSCFIAILLNLNSVRGNCTLNAGTAHPNEILDTVFTISNQNTDTDANMRVSHFTSRAYISRVNATSIDGRCLNATIVLGGPGSNFVDVIISSKPGQSMYSNVTIYSMSTLITDIVQDYLENTSDLEN